MTGASAERIVAAARGWIGTPYRHQASVRGGGADCLGLLRGVWREVYGDEPEPVPAYTADWSEPAREERLWAAARRHLRECPAGAAARPGEVLLFRMRAGSVAKHLGILSRAGESAAFIHAYSGHAVLESPLSDPWQRRIAARFAFPTGGS
ncbi:peptidase [Frigidibacter mobilis]|uniref:NlpC/P60 family phage cell wall peptidase n=1 Tax=Frigidibacter mobilis TaxID=1335048 RepID=A0A159Z5K4_9RHOB|nr:peptidase [Frigidibacter mobilis]AMY69688.1 NlpC/P60 family phage cell wall peptidase [Frigidibacter mobilis]